jgi:arylsulfatase A-like enzyme
MDAISNNIETPLKEGTSTGVREYVHALLFAMIPGLVLFALTQLLTGVNEGYAFPLAAAVEYFILFFLVCIMGIAAGVCLKLIRPHPFPLRAMLSISFVAILLLAACGLLSNLFGTSRADNPEAEYFFITGSFLGLILISWFVLGKRPSYAVWPYALFVLFSIIFIIWSIKAPEKAFLAKPGYFWANLYMLACISGTTYLLRRFIHIGVKAELVVLIALLVLIFSNHMFFYRKSVQIHTAGAPGAKIPTVNSEKPSIIFIVWDTVRRDHMSLYGYARGTTPFLEGLAKQSVVYSKAVSVSPWTLPSHASMFTGLYPRAHGAHVFYKSGMTKFTRDWQGLFSDVLTLAEILGGNGYGCGMITANSLLGSRENNFSQGFDYVVYFPNPFFLDMKYYDSADHIGDHIDPLVPDKYNYYLRNPFLNAKQINSLALKWIDSLDRNSPFFLMLNYMDAHEPYYPPPDMIRFFPGFSPGMADRDLNSLGQELKADERGLSANERSHLVSQYDANILFLDQQLDRFMEQLRLRGLLDGLLIVITSDHGEFFGEHGFLGHGQDVYSELADIPLIIKYPYSQKRGMYKQMIENREIFYILLEQAGLEIDIEDHPWDAICERYHGNPGHRGKSDRERRAVYYDDFKFIQSGDGAHELYNIKDDPAEDKNIIELKMTEAKKGQMLLRDYLEAIPDRLEEQGEFRQLNAKEIQDLKALGYLH